MFSIYFFGMLCALVIAGFASRFGLDRSDEMPFVLELPPYRVPGWRPILRTALNRSGQFVRKAGKIIFAVTVSVWILGYFPNYGADLGASWLGTLGRWIEPIFEPIGLDWRYGVAVLTAFLAREVFVGTLGTILGIEGAEENMIPLVEQIQASGLPIGSGLALLVFFAIALNCVSTVAVLAREASSWRLVSKMVVSYLVLAWLGAFLVFRLSEWIAG
jgi:ferrous iron transport protein B